MKFPPLLFEEGGEAFLKNGEGETFGLLLDEEWPEGVFAAFERANGFDQGIHGLLAEEDASGVLWQARGIGIKAIHGFADTTTAKGNYGTTEGERLDRDDSKVFFTGK